MMLVLREAALRRLAGLVQNPRHDYSWRRSDMRLILFLAAALVLSGCGLVALPFRATGDVIEVVPVVGKPIGAPVHAVGDAID